MTDEQFRALDPEHLKAAYRADAIWLNGPRRALIDAATAEFLDEGRVSDVGGIPMRTVGRVHVPNLDLFLSAQRPPYTELTVDRTTDWVFKKSEDVHELVAPSGAVYVMQSMSRHIDPPRELAKPEGRVPVHRERFGLTAVAVPVATLHLIPRHGACSARPLISKCRTGRTRARHLVLACAPERGQGEDRAGRSRAWTPALGQGGSICAGECLPCASMKRRAHGRMLSAASYAETPASRSQGSMPGDW